MKQKTITKLFSQTAILVATFFAVAQQAKADIYNPSTGLLGGNGGAGTADAQSGQTFVDYFLVLWNASLTIGALLVLLYFVWGAVEWITSAGDAGKLTTARNKMLHAFIGLLLLVSSYTLIGFIGSVLFDTNFNILKPTFITSP